jgi:hypothetical protein
LREEIVNHPLLKDIVPFLRTCRTTGEFWQFIKYKFGSYAERRQFIWDEFRPMFERLDGSKATPADFAVSAALEKFDTETTTGTRWPNRERDGTNSAQCRLREITGTRRKLRLAGHSRLQKGVTR